MTTTSTADRGLDHRAGPTVPLATIAGRVGRVGAIFVVILGVVHAIVNTMGFAQLGYGPWADYLIFGLGISVIGFLLAYGAWRIAGSSRPRWVTLVLVGLGGLLLMLQLVGIAITDPALLLRPLGPGLWSLVCGPALIIEVVALIVRWVGGRSRSSR
ncbi:hypothetical protein [Microlunatus speluncae]|uniref:hypothetical protein n=1 Tax=Microlunatus speluncae TaxID=2594267 RepID=UPI0012660AE9|nr:hypothetical protein [Microlunatus speluncae]